MLRPSALTMPVVMLLSIPEGVADGDRSLADDDFFELAALDRHELDVGRIDLDDREVAVGISAHQLRGQLDAVGEGDVQRVRALDDVIIRDDVAVRIPDPPRPLAFGQRVAALVSSVALRDRRVRLSMRTTDGLTFL